MARRYLIPMVGLMAILPGEIRGQILRPHASESVTLPPVDGRVSWVSVSLAPAAGVSGFQVIDDAQVAGMRAAARFAEDSTAVLFSLLKAYADHHEIFDSAAAKQNERARHTIYAATAVNPKALEDFLARLQTGKPEARREANAIVRALKGLGGTIVSLFAEGTIRSAIDGPTDGGTSSAGTGSLGLAVDWANDWHLSVSVAVASSVDTVRDEVGAIVLVPAAGRGRLSTFLMEGTTPVYVRRKLQLGSYWYVAGGNSLWEVDSSGTSLRRSTSVVGAGLGFYRKLLPPSRLLNTDISAAVRAGVAARWIQGDAAQDDSFLAQALDGSSDKSYIGLEAGLEFQIGAVLAGVQWYRLGKGSDDTSIPGLTGGRLVIGLSVSGNVVSGPVSTP